MNAEAQRYSAKSCRFSFAAKQVNCPCSFLFRSYIERHVISLGKIFQLDGRRNIYLPKMITWHNNLLNFSKIAMHQQFKQKKNDSLEERATIHRILLSVMECSQSLL